MLVRSMQFGGYVLAIYVLLCKRYEIQLIEICREEANCDYLNCCRDTVLLAAKNCKNNPGY